MADVALALDDPRHGTVNGYRNLHCRCDECREAQRVSMRDYYRARGRRPRSEYLAEVIHHGLSRYKAGGCRCDVCRAAAAARKRRQRANNIEHFRAYWRDRYWGRRAS